MNRLEIHIKWRFYILGILTGILVSGFFQLINHKPFSEGYQRVTPPPMSLDGQNQKQNEIPVIEGKIKINQATHEELVSLPGIGEAKASAIIVYREKYGAFERAEELLYVPGIGEEQLSTIKPFIVIP